MQVFLSYASQDRALARSVELALCEQGHDVFFDRDDLPAGEEFHSRIRRAIEEADLVIFLISPEAVDAGSYTITEVEIAQEVRKNPNGRILPVLVRPTPMNSISPYLTAVTLLEPQGNIPASIALSVERLASQHNRKRFGLLAAALSATIVVAISGYLLFAKSDKATTIAGTTTATTTTDSQATNRANGILSDSGTTPSAITGKDGAPGVLVPAGRFIMGDNEEAPERQVYVDSFYIDKFEVTTERFDKFLKAAGAGDTPLDWEELDLRVGGKLPVIGVTWHEANAYCAWVGRRLPTEAEWEKAARGTDARKYPWGNSPPTVSLANYENASPNPYDGGLLEVGHYPLGQSPYGVFDMAGNAAEWVSDWYAESFVRGDNRNPHGPDTGEGKVMRGGGRFDPNYRINSIKRYYASRENRDETVGFRCARNLR